MRLRAADYLGVAILVLVGLLLRAYHYSALGLTHYDEGAYALSGFWSLHGWGAAGLFSWQKFISPPGYFALVGLAYRFGGGPSDTAAIWVNILAGTCTIALAWWAGRRWFGAQAGLFSAALVAFSEYQIAFSRSALTDSLFAFLFLLSLALIGLCIEKGLPWYALIAGLAVGATWNVKYHGWLSLAIAAGALCLFAIAHRKEWAKSLRSFALLGLAAVVAVACFLPWLYYMQSYLGGYRNVVVMQQRYLDFQWWFNFLAQARMQAYFDGWLSRLSPALAFLLSFGWQILRDPSRRWNGIALFLILLLSGFVLSGPGTWAVLALVGLLSFAKSQQPFPRLLGYAFLVLLVLTPCYTPFARLLLPWVLIANLLAGAGICYAFRFFSPEVADENSSQKNAKRLGILGGIACALLLFGVIAGFRTKTDARTFAPTNGIRYAAQNLMIVIPKDAAVFVVANPEIAFYFRCAGYRTNYDQFIAGNGGLPEPLNYRGNGPVYVVGSYYAHIEMNWEPVLTEVPGRFQLIAQAAAPPSDIRLLDDFSTREVREYLRHPDERYDLQLYRMNPIPTAQMVGLPPFSVQPK